MGTPSRERTVSDVADIEAVLRDYIEGWYGGDTARMDRALHDDLVKRMPVSDDAMGSGLRPVTKVRMLELTAGRGGNMSDPECEILIDEVAGDIAAARLVSPEYLDFVHLAKTPDGWKIANVLFHLRA